ncbi:MAG TPA: hypothetical protein VED41_07985 [Solirubrobacteraceae bacterium]|nr:hypothetical protein [Solirubrobacteraceae bacterium]
MRRLLTSLCLPLSALALAACGTTATSVSGFSGVKREVAQAIATFQSDSSSSEQKKICEDDVAAAVVRSLGAVKGCEAAFKAQLGEVDNPELVVNSVQLGARGTTASAAVKSIYEGKSRTGTMLLVKEGGRWRISGL